MNFKSLRDIIDYYQTPERLKDNIELVSGLIHAQKSMLDMQEKQQELQAKILNLTKENDEIKNIKKFVFAEGRKYLIDPESPDRPLCPICTIQFKSPVPMYSESHCTKCKISL